MRRDRQLFILTLRWRLGSILLALVAPGVVAFTCKSSVETSGTSPTSTTTAAPSNASTGGMGGGLFEVGGAGAGYPPDADPPWDAWCAPDANPNSPDMVASCCNNEPCWGYCIPQGNGWVCDCYGIQGGCPLDSGLVCCEFGACADPDICPPGN